MNDLKYPKIPVELEHKIRDHRGEASFSANSIPEVLPKDNWSITNIGLLDLFKLKVPSKLPPKKVCDPSIIVAVVDTGIDYTHPNLKENIWVNEGESGAWEPAAALKDKISCRDKSCNGLDDDNDGFVDDVVGWDFVNEVPLPYDTHGHGTHIAGIISSSANDAMVGVCPKVTIMPLKYYDTGAAGSNNLLNTVRAIRFAIQHGAQIINYSGGGADPSPSERLAVEEARKQGVLFVAAAGNDGHNNDTVPYFPQSYRLDNIIGVASINRFDSLLPSSNYGKTVEIAAPGLGIVSTLPDGKMGTMSGTSQATAFVTGAAALLASQMKANGESFNYSRIKSALQVSAKPLPGRSRYQMVGSGILQVQKAALALQQLPKTGIPAIAIKPGNKTSF